jgi:hypothetical protein
VWFWWNWNKVENQWTWAYLCLLNLKILNMHLWHPKLWVWWLCFSKPPFCTLMPWSPLCSPNLLRENFVKDSSILQKQLWSSLTLLENASFIFLFLVLVLLFIKLFLFLVELKVSFFLFLVEHNYWFNCFPLPSVGELMLMNSSSSWCWYSFSWNSSF